MTTYVYYHHMGWGWGILTALGFLLLIALVVGVVLSLVRERRAESSRELLDRRLASGEISVEEYERLRCAMSAGSGEGRPTAPPPAPA